MAATFAEQLGKTPLLADGAWGTLLQAAGLPPGHPPDEWNVSRPEVVEAVARSYVDAGSDLILTNTFGANPLTLGRNGLEGRTEEISRAGAELSVRAAQGRAFVLASIGPSGEFLEPVGSLAREDLTAAFCRQVRGLLGAEIDGFVLETMSDPAEAACAVMAIRTLCDLPTIVSMTYDSGEDGLRTMMGRSPEDVVAELEGLQIEGIGANCGRGPEAYLPLCGRLRAATSQPLWIKANAGIPVPDSDQGQVFKIGPRKYASYARVLVQAGASVIGGCCGTTPEYVAAMKSELDSLRSGK